MDYPDSKGWITKSRRPLTRQELDAQESGDLGVSRTEDQYVKLAEMFNDPLLSVKITSRLFVCFWKKWTLLLSHITTTMVVTRSNMSESGNGGVLILHNLVIETGTGLSLRCRASEMCSQLFVAQIKRLVRLSRWGEHSHVLVGAKVYIIIH